MRVSLAVPQGFLAKRRKGTPNFSRQQHLTHKKWLCLSSVCIYSLFLLPLFQTIATVSEALSFICVTFAIRINKKRNSMAGLYVHIPFCKSRCLYCGFYSTTLIDLSERYVNAVIEEMRMRRDYLPTAPHTIYIGGGTPSVLSPKDICALFSAIDTNEAEEVTMECNPDDVTDDFATMLRDLPVNRVSMGAQTFNDKRLRFIQRRHTAADVAVAVNRLRRTGISNISIDLIYGFPNETMDEWRNDICHALALDVEHISAYALTYEEGTPLCNMLNSGSVAETEEELYRAMYYELCEQLQTAGYDHYELSNFARERRRSLHNSGYWRRTPYLGLGAAAHSYDGKSRQWNVADAMKYIDSIEHGIIPAERETLNGDTQYNDDVMLSLRTAEGIDLKRFEQRHGRQRTEYLKVQSLHYTTSGLLANDGATLRLTRDGLFVSDMVTSDLMLV